MAGRGHWRRMTDLALALLRHGYRALGRERERAGGTDPFVARLLGRRTVVVRGHAGARLFYDESVIRRRGAVPPPLAWLLFGRGAVHGLDDNSHRDRKLLLVDALAGVQPLVAEAGERLAAADWSEPVMAFDRLVEVYGTAALHWAGIEVADEEAAKISRRLAAIVDGFGFAGPAYARAWRQRLWSDRWAARMVREARDGRRAPSAGSPLATLAGARDLDDRTAGVELQNLIRPTIAVAWLGAFGAHRLEENPAFRARVAEDVHARRAFAQEVRRATPFTPLLAGRVRRPTTLEGVELRPGDFVVLDVWGIDHDPGRWEHPARFDPDRFLDRTPDAFDLVPQGGGHPSGHRCPGEPLTLLLLDETFRVLSGLDYRLRGSADVDLRRMPARVR